MLRHALLATGLVFLTVFIHGACTVGMLEWLRGVREKERASGKLARTYVLGVLVLLMSMAAVLQSTVWAGAYFLTGMLPEFEEALYFSLVTFTTLGYGDITLPEHARLLSAFQAANGIILFGWTTALIVSVVQYVYLQDE